MENNEEDFGLEDPDTDFCVGWREEIIKGTDWFLLIDQKEGLIDMLKTANEDQTQILRGVITFLNGIQIAASEMLSEGMVFDKGCKECGNPMILPVIESLTPDLEFQANNPEALTREKWECPECKIEIWESPESKY